MARQKKHAAHENHERWLVSYADFITLLFAFFVVMYASSQADKAKAAEVAASVRTALQDGKASSVIAAIIGSQKEVDKNTKPAKQAVAAPEDPEVVADLLPSLLLLEKELADEIKAGEMKVTMQPRGLVVTLREAAFFPSGQDTMVPNGLPSIEKVAGVIRKVGNPVRLEGHTDSVPISNSRFRSNWELSAARAIAMLDLFTKRFSINHHRLAVAGYADIIPVESNDTAGGRARNRRVDIVILKGSSLENEPPLPKRIPKPSPTAP